MFRVVRRASCAYWSEKGAPRRPLPARLAAPCSAFATKMLPSFVRSAVARPFRAGASNTRSLSWVADSTVRVTFVNLEVSRQVRAEAFTLKRHADAVQSRL